MSIYLENIIDLYKNPLNRGEIIDPSTTYRAHNPLCGDDITVDLKIEADKVVDIKHRGKGCAINQAAISLLSEEILGKKIGEILRLMPKDVIDMLGIELGPVRLKCALLGIEAIHEAIGQYKKNLKKKK